MEDTSQTSLVGYSFSPDGHRLAYMSLNSQTKWDIWTVPLDISDSEHPKPGKPEPFLRTPDDELEPIFSPDGRWIAYRSNESGTYELYVRPSQSSPAGAGGKWQISNGGSNQHPRWPREGRQLFWETYDNHIMVADYTAQGDSFTAGKPRLWSLAQILAPTGVYNMDVTADGKRLVAFVADDANGEKPPTHLTFLLNFFDELRRNAPAGK
jgi:WD40-like Beta Propeller Repeat